jgi:molybdopterin synthase sulfur carrier subunit
MRVNFYATLRAVVGQKSVELPLAEGTCVQELALEIARRWPALTDQIFDREGEISHQVHFMIGGRNIRWLPQGSATPLFSKDVIDVFPPTAGG